MRFSKMIDLLGRWLNGKATIVEKARVDNWYDAIDETQPLVNQDLSLIREELYQRIQAELNAGTRVVPLYRRIPFRVAAAVILLISVGGIYYVLRQHQGEKIMAKHQKTVIPNDINAPNTANAVLILSNGEKITLDSAGNGTLAMQGKVNVVKLADGQIAYNGTGNDVLYNTLIVPRGSKIVNLTLSDGTKVWLNAESSLRYPTAFAGKERKVEMTGEVYFEVVHNTAKPFKVGAGGMGIQVLGTHFNVNAYNDEASVKTTLLEGSVQIARNGTEEILKPGQQANLHANGSMNISDEVDLDEVMAWKNGSFLFNNQDIKSIMRQVSRWYNVDVSFEGSISKETFSGIVSRNSTMVQVLKIIEAGGVKFRIEGRKIIVIK